MYPNLLLAFSSEPPAKTIPALYHIASDTLLVGRKGILIHLMINPSGRRHATREVVQCDSVYGVDLKFINTGCCSDGVRPIMDLFSDVGEQSEWGGGECIANSERLV